MKTYTWQELNELRISKRELFSELKLIFDYSLPQDWLNVFSQFCKEIDPFITYDLIRSTTVWAYPKRWVGFGLPLSCCKEVIKLLNQFKKSKY